MAWSLKAIYSAADCLSYWQAHRSVAWLRWNWPICIEPSLRSVRMPWSLRVWMWSGRFG